MGFNYKKYKQAQYDSSALKFSPPAWVVGAGRYVVKNWKPIAKGLGIEYGIEKLYDKYIKDYEPIEPRDNIDQAPDILKKNRKENQNIT